MNCTYCNKELVGRQLKFCSDRCGHSYYRIQNPKRHVLQNKVSIHNQMQKRRDYVTELKRLPCTDCGVSYDPYVMDFDHVRGVKRGHVSQMVQRGMAALIDEIAKCELVCANCHRMRTLTRRKALITE